MRRALIPVLTRMKDFAGGVDQYIEMLNRYPEDEALAREAAIYASSNGIAARLRDYYAKASADSPKDFRWPMVLARIETQLEDFAAAIASYTRAAGVRPDRADLLIARLNLEERLLRFDEAAATAERLYDLTYRNPRWMEKLAEIRARQGRTADAVTALRKAWIEGHADSAELSMRWRSNWKRGTCWRRRGNLRKMRGSGLRRKARASYIRMLMRQREMDAALAALAKIKDTAPWWLRWEPWSTGIIRRRKRRNSQRRS